MQFQDIVDSGTLSVHEFECILKRHQWNSKGGRGLELPHISLKCLTSQQINVCYTNSSEVWHESLSFQVQILVGDHPYEFSWFSCAFLRVVDHHSNQNQFKIYEYY